VHPPTARRLPHLEGCGWFWAWAAVGVVGAVGLDIVLVLPLAGVLAYGLARFRGGRRHTEGILTGAGVPFLYVAYINRDGVDSSPWPWLAIGAALVVGGVLLHERNRIPR